MIGFYLKQFLKMTAQHIVFPVCYAWNRRKKVHPRTVVFADAHKEQCPEQMRCLLNMLKSDGYQITEYFFDLEKIGTIKGLRVMLRFMRIYATSQFIILQDNFLPVSSCKKRKETTVIQLWHGCGVFKKFGYDAEDDIPLYYKGNVYKNYDLVTVSSPYCCSFFQSAMRISRNHVVKPLGCSYTDRYYDSEYCERIRKKIEQHYGSLDKKKVIVWAPTFRGNAGCQEDLKTRKLPGEECVDALSKQTEYLVIKSLHPHMLHGEKQLFQTSELLVVADLLITDYSSVFFEYLLMDRPIVFFAPDYEQYHNQRGWYLEYSELPGQIVRDTSLLSDTVKSILNAPGLQALEAQKRDAFRRKYMECCDGNATGRIIKYMKNKENNRE